MLHCINHLHPVNQNRWDVHAQVGKRLPILKALLENPYTPWQTVVVKERQWSWELYTTNRLAHSRVVSHRATCTAYPLGPC